MTIATLQNALCLQAIPRARSYFILAAVGALAILLTPQSESRASLISSLAGNAWIDSNNNGLIDSGELPISGVIVTLTGTTTLGQQVSLSTATATSGSYSFASLLAGTYALTELQPLNYIQGKTSVGTPGGTLTNNMLTIANIPLSSGFTGINNNFGQLGLTTEYASKVFLVIPAPPPPAALYPPVPEPSTWVLLALGALALLGRCLVRH